MNVQELINELEKAQNQEANVLVYDRINEEMYNTEKVEIGANFIRDGIEEFPIFIITQNILEKN